MQIADEQFEKLVEEGISAIPEKFLKKLNNVGIVVEEEPTKEQLKENGIGAGYTLFGLYHGIPQTQRWNYGGGVLPDKITIFKNPIIAEADSAEEVREIVCETVWHEIAHHFGMDEEMVEAMEAKRRAK
jgi:predicted Zn-dependent protease with MMP-like domain